MTRGLSIDEWMRWHRQRMAEPAKVVKPINTDLELEPDAAERYEEVRAAMLESGPVYRMAGTVKQTESDSIYRCRGNGSRRGGFGVSRD